VEYGFMNIDSTNTSSLLPAQTLAEVTLPSIAGQELISSFTGAFLEQLKLLSSENNQSELLKNFQANTNSPSSNQLQSLANLLGEGGNMQTIAAQLGQELPVSYHFTEGSDVDAALTAFTNSLNLSSDNETLVPESAGQDAIDPNFFPAEIQIVQATPPADAEEFVVSFNNESSLFASSEEIHPEGLSPYADSQANQNENQQNTQDTAEDQVSSTSLTSIFVPSVMTSIRKSAESNPGETTATLQPEVDVLIKNTQHKNSLPPSLPSGEALAPKNSDSSNASDERSTLFNLNYSEESVSTVKKAPTERDLSITTDKSLLKGLTDVAQVHKNTIEAKVEIPAMAKPISHPEWSQDLGDRIIWMHNKSISSAEIKLNPQHLGPVSVRVDVNQDQASISFAAQHGSVREAIEASIPKLRDMMGTQQLNLIDVNVSQNFSSDQGKSQSQTFSQSDSRLDGVIDPLVDAGEEMINENAIVTKGLLSIYA
jgi:flagellar hook-length control protein FliK